MGERILLSEDDPQLGAQISDFLGRAGFEPTWWIAGRPLQPGEAAAYGLIILDLMLPGTYGLDILRELREGSDVPVLVLSARNDSSDKVRALKLGADDYMTKPFCNARRGERRWRPRSASQEAHYMAALIHNLGAAARLEAGEPSVQRAPVDLNALVQRCIGRHRPIARGQGVQLDYAVPETPVRVIGDDTLIEQAVSNVIYNAVRYNSRGGHVAVVLENLPGHTFRLRVLDDGPGIPENELPHVIERRVRGDAARTRGPGGHGLGLNIAWRVSVLHGWSLQLGRSEYGGLQVDFLGELPPPS